jgi:D-alanyl-D-alanine carboxypeptidase
MRGDSSFRIGSMTKMFVATTVLQLVGERRVVLDAPVERYLPGVVRGHGNDGRAITVRPSAPAHQRQRLRPRQAVDALLVSDA